MAAMMKTSQTISAIYNIDKGTSTSDGTNSSPSEAAFFEKVWATPSVPLLTKRYSCDNLFLVNSGSNQSNRTSVSEVDLISMDTVYNTTKDGRDCSTVDVKGKKSKVTMEQFMEIFNGLYGMNQTKDTGSQPVLSTSNNSSH